MFSMSVHIVIDKFETQIISLYDTGQSGLSLFIWKHMFQTTPGNKALPEKLTVA